MDKAVLGIMAEVTCCSTDVLNIDHLMEKNIFLPRQVSKIQGKESPWSLADILFPCFFVRVIGRVLLRFN